MRRSGRPRFEKQELKCKEYSVDAGAGSATVQSDGQSAAAIAGGPTRLAEGELNKLTDLSTGFHSALSRCRYTFPVLQLMFGCRHGVWHRTFGGWNGYCGGMMSVKRKDACA